MSATSVSDVNDRLSALELRVQQQEDELTVMKAALADVLRRLSASEDSAASKKHHGGKGRADTSVVMATHMKMWSTVLCCPLQGELPCVKPTPCPASPTEARLDGRETPPLSPGRRRCRLPPRGKGPVKVHLRSSVDLVDQFPGDHWNQMKHGRKRMERSQSSTWDSSEKNRNKLVKAASTSKLLAKAVKNTDKHKDPVVSQEGNSIKMFMRGRPITMFIPSDVENYDEVRTELPPERLKLEWVYGYRGRDCRANVYLLPTGEIVYFVASVAALQPHVRVWDSVSLSTLQVIGLGTFERGDSGQHLSVIDDCNDHMLTVWDWQKKSKIAEIKVQITSNRFFFCGQNHDRPKFIQCLTFRSNGDIVTGDSTGQLLVWTRNSAEAPPGKGPQGGDQPAELKDLNQSC
ncbi:hypothetical protein XENOCAPTIV_015875 [Xenoophorus captivus]|uniref:Echinoderm microtubule associated protein like 4 n=1 Tax=Xenoophorus captivus TaxID=1517983 RepID=A0ABV0R9D5_9TELE